MRFYINEFSDKKVVEMVEKLGLQVHEIDGKKAIYRKLYAFVPYCEVWVSKKSDKPFKVVKPYMVFDFMIDTNDKEEILSDWAVVIREEVDSKTDYDRDFIEHGLLEIKGAEETVRISRMQGNCQISAEASRISNFIESELHKYVEYINKEKTEQKADNKNDKEKPRGDGGREKL